MSVAPAACFQTEADGNLLGSIVLMVVIRLAYPDRKPSSRGSHRSGSACRPLIAPWTKRMSSAFQPPRRCPSHGPAGATPATTAVAMTVSGCDASARLATFCTAARVAAIVVLARHSVIGRRREIADSSDADVRRRCQSQWSLATAMWAENAHPMISLLAKVPCARNGTMGTALRRSGRRVMGHLSKRRSPIMGDWQRELHELWRVAELPIGGQTIGYYAKPHLPRVGTSSRNRTRPPVRSTAVR